MAISSSESQHNLSTLRSPKPMPKVKINETDIGDGDDSEDGVEFDEAAG